MIRTCTACGEDKPITEFPKNGVDLTGAVRHRTDCKVCYGISRKMSKKKHDKFVSSTKFRTGEDRTLTLEDWRAAMLYFRGGCAYCGVKQSRKTKLTKDHVVPVSKGGPTVRRNIIPACTSCNCSKGDTDLEEWFPKRKGYTPERLRNIKKWQKGTITV
ncbi:HNH endonuclease [compost metagenome]